VPAFVLSVHPVDRCERLGHARGCVDDLQRLDAGRAVEQLAGVRGVTNLIAIDAPAVSEAAPRRAGPHAPCLAGGEASRIEVKKGVMTQCTLGSLWAEPSLSSSRAARRGVT
jgi:hypothetical protein